MSSINLSLPVAIAADHAGFAYKTELVNFLQEKGLTLKDFGTSSASSVDYPDYAHPAAESVAKGECGFGILLCGTANGVCMTANKHPEIRAALCWENEVASLVRKHNDANMIGIPARFVSLELAKELVNTFISTPFEGGRHALRIQKMACT